MKQNNKTISWACEKWLKGRDLHIGDEMEHYSEKARYFTRKYEESGDERIKRKANGSLRMFENLRYSPEFEEYCWKGDVDGHLLGH